MCPISVTSLKTVFNKYNINLWYRRPLQVPLWYECPEAVTRRFPDFHGSIRKISTLRRFCTWEHERVSVNWPAIEILQNRNYLHFGNGQNCRNEQYTVRLSADFWGRLERHNLLKNTAPHQLPVEYQIRRGQNGQFKYILRSGLWRYRSRFDGLIQVFSRFNFINKSSVTRTERRHQLQVARTRYWM